MSLDRIGYVYTFGMDEAEIEATLETTATGVLALANDGAAYAIPVGCDYEDGTLYFRLTDDGASKKLSYLETTTEACVLLYADEPSGDSWSVVAVGPIRELTDEELGAFDEATMLERFGKPRIFDEDLDALEWSVYELDIEEVTGRKTGSQRIQ
ncbi:pyridoxamine 5'-phosphate oxidase family protein [Natronococcus occultus]|uniref:Putative flavin-nucleotide-binding protein n=1 Tax=Natronococcus occultus SP4 TaxID=694430 RepID=L0K4V9_9EURY|nr:pyridoxamine 5'-phosphate oxidase family protein [Natronococcus occultus]AGB39394.1 putative flavin-nucleotide-binding protein [Natronococcus occultus SP4]